MSEKRRRNATSAIALKEKLRKRKALSLAQKLEIIQRVEKGESLSSIRNDLNLSSSTVSTVMQNKDRIMEHIKITGCVDSFIISKRRGTVIEQMEKLLKIWIHDNNKKNQPLSVALIQRKARNLYNDLIKRTCVSEDEIKPFAASSGWFQRFKSRAKIRQLKFTGESASADHDAARKFPEWFARVIIDGGYSSCQVFNVDETGLFWKKMPDRTYISKEEKKAPGVKASKKFLTLLLGGNAAGDFKLKPLLIYNAKCPRSLKNRINSELPVIWKSNKKAWMNAELFQEWFHDYFIPSVKEYCYRKNVAFKTLLLLDNAPCHPLSLSDIDPNVKVVFLPPNTTSLLQPMDQTVISAFKRYYLRNTMDQALLETESGRAATLVEFWKSYNLLHAIKNIAKSWDDVKESTMNRCWKKLYPQFVLDFEENIENVTAEVVKIGNQLELEMDADDVEDLINSHSEELSNNELIEMLNSNEELKKNLTVTSFNTSNELGYHDLNEERHTSFEENPDVLETECQIELKTDADVEEFINSYCKKLSSEELIKILRANEESKKESNEILTVPSVKTLILKVLTDNFNKIDALDQSEYCGLNESTNADLEENSEQVIAELVEVGNQVELIMDDDVRELLNSQSRELSNDDIIEMLKASKESSEKGNEALTIPSIKSLKVLTENLNKVNILNQSDYYPNEEESASSEENSKQVIAEFVEVGDHFELVNEELTNSHSRELLNDKLIEIMRTDKESSEKSNEALAIPSVKTLKVLLTQNLNKINKLNQSEHNYSNENKSTCFEENSEQVTAEFIEEGDHFELVNEKLTNSHSRKLSNDELIEILRTNKEPSEKGNEALTISSVKSLKVLTENLNKVDDLNHSDYHHPNEEKSARIDENSEQVITEFVEVGDQFESVHTEKLANSCPTEFLNDELIEILRTNKESREKSNETLANPSVKTLTIKILTENLNKINEALNQLEYHDPNEERSLEVKKEVHRALTCYQIMLEERRNNNGPVRFFKKVKHLSQLNLQ